MPLGLHIKDKSGNSLYWKASAFRKNIRRTEPHKHNSYFELVYLSAGKGYHTIDNQEHEVRPPVLFFIRQDKAEVSFALSFKDPSHFAKYFKRHTNYTPGGFRAMER